LAKTKLPDALSRRHLLEGGLDPAKAFSVAEAYLEAGREVEAIDFLSAAKWQSHEGARENLLTLRAAALERGDAFLMRAVTGTLGEDPSSDEWKSLAAAATQAGRVQDAETAMRLATVGDQGE
jgi:thioredoxin-like negative regulator of GroEL